MELKIDRHIAVRYMGIKTGEPDELTVNILNEAEKLLREDMVPSYTYLVHDVIGRVMIPVDEKPKVVITTEDESEKIYVDDEGPQFLSGIGLSGTSLRLPGMSIINHLENSEKVVVLCATLGSKVDARIRRLQVSDVAMALAYDALASVAVDELCDGLQEEIAEKLPDYEQTTRFSPGYGDMPLTIQGEFLASVNAEKRCGVSITEGGMLTPVKTITAVFGLKKPSDSSDRPEEVTEDSLEEDRGCGT